MALQDIKDPRTGSLLFRYDQQTGEVQLQRRGILFIANLNTMNVREIPQTLSCHYGSASHSQPSRREISHSRLTPTVAARATGPPR